jgi:hypothetical protein
MLIDRPTIPEGSIIVNPTVPSGTTEPANPSVGELFFRTDLGSLRTYSGSAWAEAGSVSLNTHINDQTLHLTSGQNTWIDAITATSAEINFLTGTATNINVRLVSIESVNTTQNTNITALQTQANTSTSGLATHIGDATVHLTSAQNTLLDGLSASLTATELNYSVGVTSALQTQLNTLSTNKYDKTGGTISSNVTINGTLSMNNTRIMGLAPITGSTPGTDAVTKDYVDTLVQGLAWKDAARVATTTNITLSGLQTIDGVTVVSGERVVVKNQTTTSQNGIYLASAGAWSRSPDANSAAELDGLAVFVRDGTVHKDTAWVQTNPIVTVDTTAVIFSQFAAAGGATEGNGISIAGSTISTRIGNGLSFSANTMVVNPTTRFTFTSSQLDLANTGVVAAGNTVTVGDTANIPSITVDQYGRVTVVSNNAISVQGANVNLSAVAAQTGAGILAFTATGSAALRTLTPAVIGFNSAHFTIGNPQGIAGNPTFNLTAFSTNTASSLVARDASGNFSAGTISAAFTGALAGNASTATALLTPRNFSIVGGATASAISFDGQGAVALNVTSLDATVLAGTIAAARLSGGYDINISGLAANATNAVNATYSTRTAVLGTFDGTSLTSPSDPRPSLGSRASDILPNSYACGLFSEFKNSALYGVTGNYSGLITYANWVGTTAATGDPSYQLLFSPAAANSTAVPSLRIRAGIDTTWGAWGIVLNSANFNSYAPTLTGVGASGTWNIKSATTTTADNSLLLGGLALSTGATNNVANQVVRTDSNGYIQAGWINTISGDNGTTAISRVYASNDGYIRYYTLGNFTSQIQGAASGTWNIKATTAGTADTTNAVAWTNVSGRPTTLNAFTNDSGFITTNGRAYPRRSDGGDLNFFWSGQSGQPTWLWGGSDGVNMYVYNPSNFSVNYAATAGTASNVTSISDAVGSAYTWTGQQSFVSSANTGVATSSGTLMPQASSSSTAATISFHRPGAYGLNMGLDNDNVFRIGGWSAAANRLTLDMSGNLGVAGSMTAAGSVVLTATNISSYAPTVAGSGAYGTWAIDISGNSATTNQRSFGNVRTDGINRGSYGAISIAGNNGGWSGIDFTDSAMTLMMQSGGGTSGVFKNNNTWVWGFDGNGSLTYGTVPWSQITSSPDYLLKSGGTVTGAFAINNSSPTITMQDTDNLSAFLHVNSNLVYFLRGAGINSTTWDTGPNGRHPMTMNLTSGDVVFSGNVTAYSDLRLKKDIKPITYALQKVEQLQGVTYSRLESDTRQTGLIAQDVQAVLPEAVVEQEDGMLTVAYGNMMGLMVEAIKELNRELAAVKAELAQLKTGNSQ